MSVWLTPSGQPVVGGTYFPPHDSQGRIGFRHFCTEVGEMWRTEPQKFLEEGSHVLGILQSKADEREATDLDLNVVRKRVLADFQNSYDCDYGGFGGAPKFPQPSLLELLGQFVWSEQNESHGSYCKTMFCTTLDNMQRGGIADHLAGGFHRYSVDAQWHIPHFEKMLYDQGQLLKLYTNAWLITKDESYRQTACAVRDYLLCDLVGTEGSFHAGEDADSLDASGVKREGAYWTWSQKELSDALEDPELYSIAALLYDVQLGGNADPHRELVGRNTLWRVRPTAEICTACSIEEEELEQKKAEINRRLIARRAERALPHRDDKTVLAWNSYVVEALMLFSSVFDCNVSYRAAKKALDFMREKMQRDGKLVRTWRHHNSSVPAFAQDYAALIRSLQRAYQTDSDKSWLEWAKELQATMDELFWDASRDGYTVAASIAGNDLVVMVEDYDGPEPSTNSLASWNLCYWYQLDSSSQSSEKLEAIDRRTASAMMNNPQAVPAFISSKLLTQRGWCKITCSLESAKELSSHYLPHVIFDYKRDQEGYFVCKGESCFPPVNTVNEVLLLLD